MFDLLQGHTLTRLRDLPDESVHCCVCSPPFYGLRAYGTEPQVWGGDQACEHDWTSQVITRKGSTNGRSDLGSTLVSVGGKKTVAPGLENDIGETKQYRETLSDKCQKCGAWRGELGQEPTPEEFVAHLVEVFREVRRVLHPSGVLWVNMGDSYATIPGKNNGNLMEWSEANAAGGGRRAGGFDTPTRGKVGGYKQKDLIGVPWLLAFALRADGWYLRHNVPWLKRAVMPESVEDRPATAHEFFFVLAKRDRYFYDVEATRLADSGKSSGNGYKRPHRKSLGGDGQDAEWTPGGGRNRRTSDWFFDSMQAILAGGEGLLHNEDGDPLALVVNLRPLKEAHFAAYPEQLVAPIIKASTSERGACPTCLEPWRRVIEKRRVPTRPGKGSKVNKANGASGATTGLLDDRENRDYIGNRDPQRHCTETVTIGWEPGCRCYATPPLPDMPEDGADNADEVIEERRTLLKAWEALPTVPCKVLDPFAGACTTALAALRLGRSFVGTELNPEYCTIGRRRLDEAGVLANLFFPTS